MDIVVAVDPAHYDAVFEKRFEMRAELGDLSSAFTGEHVGKPRLVIALYGPDGLHVDFKFAKLEDITDRVDEPTILWERKDGLSRALAKGGGAYPRLMSDGPKIVIGPGFINAWGKSVEASSLML